MKLKILILVDHKIEPSDESARNLTFCILHGLVVVKQGFSY